MKAGGFLIGTPADIIEQLEAVEKRYPGLDGHNLTVKSHDGQSLSITLAPELGVITTRYFPS